MTTTEQIGALLHNYILKQESAFADLRGLCDYIRKYAARQLKEQPDLAPLSEISESALLQNLEELSASKDVYIQGTVAEKTFFIGISFYSAYFERRYADILENPDIPFPALGDIPKQLPSSAIEKQDASALIPAFYRSQNTKSLHLYALGLCRDIPPILFPECVPLRSLVHASIVKIRRMLKKDEFHDYFQKKLSVANPNKERSAQNFFSKFVRFPDSDEFPFSTDGDTFYFWTQLCYFIRQDFEKVKDRVSEDTNILQAVAISEVWTSTIKEAALKEQAKEKAASELESALDRPPYFFSMDNILKLNDSKGALLYGQLGEDGLKAALERLATEPNSRELPKLLVFKVESGTRYFVYKSKVFPLAVRLANEAHDAVEKTLIEKWYGALNNFQKLPEMTDGKAFEETLKREVREVSPILHALLTSNFLMPLHYELDGGRDAGGFRFFSGGKLLPYSELLMLKNKPVLDEAKLRLPFWHSVPLLAWIASLFLKRDGAAQKEKAAPAKEEAAEELPRNPQESRRSKREALSESAKSISSGLVPEGSTIDRELDSYLKQWNKLITKEANRQLTDDVNALIRDYMRKVIHTLSVRTFTQERVQNLASTLVHTPNMRKIKDEDALYMYVQLYILRLVSNT